MTTKTTVSKGYTLEDKIHKYFLSEIKRFENAVKGYESDGERVRAHTAKSPTSEKAFNGMTANGTQYDSIEKEDAGKAIIMACREVKIEGGGEIGEYRGFKMSLSYDAFFNQFNLNLKGNLSHKVILGADVFGNITRIDNILDDMELKQVRTIEKLDNVKQQLKNAKIEVKKHFTKEKELKEKTARLSKLDQQLNMSDAVDPIQTVSELDRAKDYIMDFIANEYDKERISFDYKDLTCIDIAYTTTKDEKHEIQARVDLEAFAVNTYIDEILVHQDQYGSLKELNDYHLQHLDFGSLVSANDEDIERIEMLTIDKDTDLDDVIDRLDSDSRDSSVITQGDLDEREKGREQVSRPSVMRQLSENRKLLNHADTDIALLCRSSNYSVE